VSHGRSVGSSHTVAAVMAARVVWGLCLALGAMVTGIGIELHASGAGPLVSFPIVAAGIVFLPLASAGIDRVTRAAAASPD
jgi:hypothetical protein